MRYNKPRSRRREQECYQSMEQGQGSVALLGVYTPVVFPGKTDPIGAFEIYQFYGPTAARIDSMRRWLFGGIGISFGTLYLGLVSIVWRGWKTVNAQKRQFGEFNAELEVKVKERTVQLEEANEDLVFSQRLAAVGELSGGIGHELRPPLPPSRMRHIT